MTLLRRVAAAFFAVTVVMVPAACGDDPGEDKVGDNEIVDEGD